jgi:membrane associated rhomboid family serine protease
MPAVVTTASVRGTDGARSSAWCCRSDDDGFAFANRTSVEPLVGASGAIAGVLGAYLVLYPRAKMWSLVPFLFFIPLRITAWLVLGSWFALQWVYSAGYGAAGAGSVAYLAHVFGFIAGAVIGLLVRASSPPPVYPVHPRYSYR